MGSQITIKLGGMKSKGLLAIANSDVAVVFATKCITEGDDYDERASHELKDRKELQFRNYAIGTVFAATAWLEAE